MDVVQFLSLSLCHLLAIEQGRHLRLPRHRRVCRLCHNGALGDERHMLLECPALADLRDEYSPLVAECSGVMARLVWARNPVSPWSAGTSLLASIECHADDRQTLFHPCSLVGCQRCCILSFLPNGAVCFFKASNS